MHKNTFLFLAPFLWANLASTSVIEIIADGVPVVGPGVFVDQCIYGDDASLSDHAPIHYGALGITTWNISNRVSHLPIYKPWGTFLGHKFKTNSEHSLIDEGGKPALAGYKSEVIDVIGKKELVNEFFGRRLRAIATKIKELFASQKINYFAIQEIPNRLKTDVDGKNFHKMISEILAPELEIHFPQKPPNWKDWPPDVALITKAGVTVSMNHVDAENRLQPYCINGKDTCFVVNHFAFPKSDEALLSNCKVMVDMAGRLHEEGISDVIFIGDFNTSAENIDRVCRDLPGFVPAIHTSASTPKSCRDNDGTHSENNIDLAIIFNAKKLVSEKLEEDLFTPKSWATISEESEASRFTVKPPRVEMPHLDAEIAVLSPDGSKIVSKSGKKIQLVESKTGNVIRTINDHKEMVRQVAFNPNGKNFLSASSDTTVKLWDADSGEIIRTFPHARSVWSAAFNKEGNKIVSGGAEKTARVWDVESGDTLVTIGPFSKIVTSVAFADEDRSIRVVSAKRVSLWDAETGKPK